MVYHFLGQGLTDPRNQTKVLNGHMIEVERNGKDEQLIGSHPADSYLYLILLNRLILFL